MRTLVLICVLAAFVLTGCGAAAPGPSASPAPTSAPAVAESPSPSPTALGEPELVAAVRSYSEACLDGRARDAWRLLSRRVQKRIGYAAYKDAILSIALTYGDARLRSVKIISLAGDMARVTYRFTDPAVDQVKEPWVVERGQWRYDD